MTASHCYHVAAVWCDHPTARRALADMLFTLTYNTSPATDLGYLLHKNPGRAHAFEFPFGHAHVFFPEASVHRCTAALLLEVDPIDLARGRRNQGVAFSNRPLEPYVNDRPYVCSSYLSTAMRKVFGTAISGRSKERPELAARALPFEVRLSVVACRDGEAFVRRLFEPLGYRVMVEAHVLDELNLDWGNSIYFTISLSGTQLLSDLLSHVYVLVPVMDGNKHYWVGEDEVDKLLRHGEGWLATHLERDLIVRRYLRHQRNLSRQAADRLLSGDAQAPEVEESAPARPAPLDEQRLAAVVRELKSSGARRVLDLGCGEARLARALLDDPAFSEIVGVDVSPRALEAARRRLSLEHLPERKRSRLKLRTGSLLYRDKSLSGYDAAAIVEVIEHLDPPRIAAFERTVFECARPTTVVVTTPNAEYNASYQQLAEHKLRHADHRFEWSRLEFSTWASRVVERFGYAVRFEAIGAVDPMLGAPTQMAVFTR